MVIKLPRSRESTPVAVTPPSTTLVRFAHCVRACVLSVDEIWRVFEVRVQYSSTGSGGAGLRAGGGVSAGRDRVK